MKNILILDGNPKQSSFCSVLTDTYEIEAREQHQTRRFSLHKMAFNPNLENGFDKEQPLEPCLLEFQEALLWAEHIVIVAPIWWGGLPAKLKGLIDRAFLPGFAFKYDNETHEVIQYLTGKTARIVLTMDSPDYYAEEQANPVLEQLEKFTLSFCGIDVLQKDLLGSVISADDQQKAQWLETMKVAGTAGI